MESSLFGVSIRGWLALITVVSGLLFLYASAFYFGEGDLRLTIITAVVGFINLALGYYLGQKSTEAEIEAEVERRIAERFGVLDIDDDA